MVRTPSSSLAQPTPLSHSTDMNGVGVWVQGFRSGFPRCLHAVGPSTTRLSALRHALSVCFASRTVCRTVCLLDLTHCLCVCVVAACLQSCNTLPPLPQPKPPSPHSTPQTPNSNPPPALSGALAGVLGSLFGAGGPAIIFLFAYLNGREEYGTTPDALRSTSEALYPFIRERMGSS